MLTFLLTTISLFAQPETQSFRLTRCIIGEYSEYTEKTTVVADERTDLDLTVFYKTDQIIINSADIQLFSIKESIRYPLFPPNIDGVYRYNAIDINKIPCVVTFTTVSNGYAIMIFYADVTIAYKIG